MRTTEPQGPEETPEQAPEEEAPITNEDTSWLARGILAIFIIAILLVVGISVKEAYFTPTKQQTASSSTQTPPASHPANRATEVRVTVQQGQTLIGLAGRNWRQVCSHNRLPNCNQLRIGQVLVFPAGITPVQQPVQTPPASRPTAAAATSRSTPRATITSASPRARQQGAVQTPRVVDNRNDGFFPWRRVGASPLTRFDGGNPARQDHARSIALSAMGFNSYESRAILDRFNSNNCVAGTITAGDEFERGSFVDARGNVRVTGPVRLLDRSEPTFEVCRVYLRRGDVVGGYTLTRDITVTLVRKCANVVIERRPPAPPAPPSPSPVPPPPSITQNIPPTPVPPLTPTPESRRFCNNWRLNAVVGVELELDEAWARSLYGAWGVYCMHQLRDGQIGFGVGGQLAFYGSDPGEGRFRGHLIAAGPSMMRVWDSGRDLELKFMVGDYRSSYREGDYRSSEHRNILAISAAHNDYSRRLRGETSMPERQLFAMVGVPIGGDCEASWQGNAQDCSRLGLYYNAGARQWVNNNIYVQAGVLGEIRSGEDYFSCSLRVGVANDRRTLGVHAGVNACDGGIVPAVGAWFDLGTHLRIERAERRAAAITEDTGEGREVTTTFESVPLNETREDGNSQTSVAANNNNGESPPADTETAATD